MTITQNARVREGLRKAMKPLIRWEKTRTDERIGFHRGYWQCAEDIAKGKLDDLLLELGWVKK